jgi:phosphopantothenoylcysteine synthetase/decarboxylase
MAVKKTDIKGLKVLLGVTGGVAAFKAVDLASKLTAAGSQVNTVMTQNACQLIMPKSFEAVTGGTVYTNMWSGPEEFKINHVSLTDWADIIVVAPATANIIGKVANGICDDLLSTILCVCWQKPVIFAPAMNNRMWENPIIEENIKKIKKLGFEIVGPETGRLACGTEAVGRMSEPADILEAITKLASTIKRK